MGRSGWNNPLANGRGICDCIMTIGLGALALMELGILGAGDVVAPTAQDVSWVDEIVVTGSRTTETHTVVPTGTIASMPDAAGLVARIPGGALVNNGGLSGQVQYRGLYGDRVLVRINGQRFQTGGPNSMDPPLHYAPMLLINSLGVDRGVSPVRNGPGLAGGVNARLKQADFAQGEVLQPYYDLGLSYRAVDDSYGMGGVVGLSNQYSRINLLASREEGGDTRLAGGKLKGTRYDRTLYGLSGGLKGRLGELGLDLRRQETGPSGNLPFAMDIVWFDADFGKLTYQSPEQGLYRLEATLGFNDIDHGMNNYGLRQGPTMTSMKRLSLASAKTRTADLRVVRGLSEQYIAAGFDFEQADKNVLITNPDVAGFFFASLPDVDMSRYGGHVEWRGALSRIQSEMGLRLDHHEISAGVVLPGDAVPVGPRGLASLFNAEQRQWSGQTVDVVSRFWLDMGNFTPRLTLARKTRVPNAVERFAWMPTEASGGLADGNNYVGDLKLKPETAWIIEGGLDWSSSRAYARPTIYYRRIDGYIQGVPYDDTPGVIDTPVERVSAMSGDTTPLRFANVDAELWGVDLDFGAALTQRLRLDGVATYVRGKRRDRDDNLYRMAPPNVRLKATWQERAWSVGAEVVAVASQDRVSHINGEQSSAGYALFNLSGDWQLRPGVRLEAGVENIFDKAYRDHLSGRNRTVQPDVALGEKLPGAGRGAYITVRFHPSI